MLTFGPPVEAGPSQTTIPFTETSKSTLQSQTTTTSTRSTNRPPIPSPNRSSGLTPIEVRSLKDAIDDLLADIKNEGFSVATPNQSFPELQDRYTYGRPVTPPERAQLGEVKSVDFFRPVSSAESGVMSMGLGPAYAPPASYSTKPSVPETRGATRSGSAEPRRRVVGPHSEDWKRLNSPYHRFVGKHEFVKK